MLKSSARSVIRLRGVRHNNLKNFDLDLPLNQLIVVTGLSGSGKSSLAFDTLFAEGQRRYIETFSPYARQFFDRMDKPQVDSIEGIPPAIAIEQRNAVKTTRSTVGTMTEITDYMKLLWPHVAQLHCRQCGRPVRKDSPQQIWQTVAAEVTRRTAPATTKDPPPHVHPPQYCYGGRVGGYGPGEVLITFDLPLTEKLSLAESLTLVSKQGYQRLLIDGKIVRLDDAQADLTHHASRITHLTVIQDRLKPIAANRARFIEACEQAYHFGKGKLAIHELVSADLKFEIRNSKLFSCRLHCAGCDLEYREPTPALFSFNHPIGACPTCKGFGRVISIDYDLALPDRSKTLAEGVVRPWQTGHGLESQRDLLRMCRHFEVPTDVPFEKLPKKWQDFVIEGEPDYGKDEEHEWPRAWYGVKGYFRWLESKAYKMHVRVLLSRYRAYTNCPDCKGARFQPETLLYRLAIADWRLPIECGSGGTSQSAIGNRQSAITLADFYRLPIRDALAFVEQFERDRKFKSSDPLGLVFTEVRSRLGYLQEVGLGYLTLDRPTRSLSGGETERVNLTTCLGTRLVNTLFVLDEPSVGLHPRDTERLVRILQRLRDAGNTVVVVEHEASVMRAADQIVDLGPGHGATGGQVVFQGSYREILKSRDSLTGRYLSGAEQTEAPRRRPVRRRAMGEVRSAKEARNARPELNETGPRFRTSHFTLRTSPWLSLQHASLHNLKDLAVEIPLGRFVCITGVSGSGKTTLVREVLLPALEKNFKSQISNLKFAAKASERIEDTPSSDYGAASEDEANGLTPHASRLTGFEHLGRVVLVDQSILGKTPRSNPAVYIGAFDDLREFFAQSEPAKQRGLNASAFSFNSAQGQCERCRGAGFEKIEMQFLSDVFIKCPDCDGRRYRAHILEVRVECRGSSVEGQTSRRRPATPDPRPSSLSWSIADLLDATVDEAIDFLSAFPESRPAQRAVDSLKLLQEVGLGYLRSGQPINTLSGGESQRLKLVRHLAGTSGEKVSSVHPPQCCYGGRVECRGKNLPVGVSPSTPDPRPALFLFDEPTTGLHFDDVRVLLKVFQRLVDAGHSVLVIEHNLDVIKSADWIIDLGPGAGDEGGEIVAQGTPEDIAACEASHTGRALRDVLPRVRAIERRVGAQNSSSARS